MSTIIGRNGSAKSSRQHDVKRMSPALERMVVSAPPLAPDPLAPEFPAQRSLIPLSIAMAAVVVAAVAVAGLAGASGYLIMALVLAGLACLIATTLALRTQERARWLVAQNAARNRAEVETLADRMWELQESEERFQDLIDALGDLVVHRDQEGRIVYTNKVFADLVGIDQRDLAGLTLEQIGIDVDTIGDDGFEGEQRLSSTDVAIRSGKSVRWFSWFELSVRDYANSRISHRAIARDITSHKETEATVNDARKRAEHASQSKSRFLATVSHEIRTPMNGIMGMAKLLADTGLSPEQRTYVGAVSTSATALLALIEDLLDYTKIEAGRLDIEPQPMSPQEMADNVTELLAARAYAKNIGIACHVARDVPQTIISDPGKVRQVLLNLIGNAVKFTETGGVMLKVSLAGTEETKSIVFTVSDTGPGLRPEDTDRIFEDFEQADGSSTRTHGGAGLGLAISRRLAASMGGSLSVTTRLREGSAFTFALPLAVPPASAPSRPGDRLAGRRIVILSKNRVEAEAMAMTVRAHGGEAKIATTIAQATENAAQCSSIIIDAAIEGADGKVLKRLRRNGFSAAHAMTMIAPTDRGTLGEFRASGYSTFLARPVRGETLIRMILSSPSADAKASQSSSGSRKSSSSKRDAGRSVGLSVLVAEDNDINAMLARAALVKAGHRVDIVGNGELAVEAVTGGETSQRRYDIVLMDLHMPVMDGLDAIAAIRRHEESSDGPALPIIVLSADGQETTRHLALSHGASSFITKPIDPETLARSVEERAIRATSDLK